MTDQNILILSPELPATDSGGPIRALQHLYLLNRMGYRPYLLTFFHRGQEAAVGCMRDELAALTREASIIPAPMPEPRGVMETLSRNLRYLGPRPDLWRRVAGEYERNRYPLARAFDSANACEHLVRVVTDKRIDLVIVMHAWLLHYLPVLRERCPSLRIVLDLVDLDSDLFAQLFLSGGRLSEQARRLVCWITTRRLEQRYFPMCDEFWALAPTEASKIRGLCGDGRPIPVLPTMIDVDRILPCESEGSPGHLLFLGSLFFQPNENAVIWLLRTLYPRIREATKMARLTVVGRGLTPTVELLASEMPGVTLTGYVPATRPYYEDAQVVVVPVKEGCGIRLKIIEAMAMGRAVVATPKAAEGLDVVHGKHLVIADSDNAFVSETLDLLERPDRRRELGQNGRALVECRYSWQAAEIIMATDTCLRRPTGNRDTFAPRRGEP